MENWRVRQGGLMRCCIESLHNTMEPRAELPNEGETFQCEFTDSEHHRMIFREGAWEWLRVEND